MSDDSRALRDALLHSLETLDIPIDTLVEQTGTAVALIWTEALKQRLPGEARLLLDCMSPNQRLAIFANYCPACGALKGECDCYQEYYGLVA